MKKMLLITIICCIFLFSSCKKDTVSGDAVTLRVYTSFGESDGGHDTYQAILKSFQENNNIIIEDNSTVSNEAWKESILSMFASDEEPDVLFYFAGADAEPFVSEDRAASLDAVRKNYPSYGTNINTSVLDTMKAADGENYALPVNGYWEGLFINKDLFDEHDIPIPDDWDSFLEAVSAFRQQGIIPIAVSLGEVPHYWFEFLIYNHSGPAGHLTSVPTSDNPLPKSWVDGFTDLITLYQMGAFPSDTDTISNVDSFALFQEKKAAMVLDGSWSVGQISDTENVIVIPFPAYKDGSRKNTDMIAGFSMGFYITKKAWENPEKQKACVDFVSAVTSNDSISLFNQNGTISPVSAKQQTAATTLLKSIASINSEATAYISAVQDTMDSAARNALFSKIPDIVTGAVTIEEALTEFIILNLK